MLKIDIQRYIGGILFFCQEKMSFGEVLIPGNSQTQDGVVLRVVYFPEKQLWWIGFVGWFKWKVIMDLGNQKVFIAVV